MNLPIWPYSLSPYYVSPAIAPSPSYCSYSYMSSPYHTSMLPSSSAGTSFNTSSGYESASAETSLLDSCLASSSPVVKTCRFDPIHQQANLLNDHHSFEAAMNDNQDDGDESDDNMSVTTSTTSDGRHRHKKRRILSRLQRQEANQRERHRMELINRAYEDLRNVLPFKKGRKRQKMSRMDTVDGAIRHIHFLLETLHGPNYNWDWAKS